MSHLEAGANTWHPDVQVPDDGDERDAASVLVALEALLDRTQYLYQRTAFGAITVASVSLAAPMSLTRQVPMNPIYDPSQWEIEEFGVSNVVKRMYLNSVAGFASWTLLPMSTELPRAAGLLGFSLKVAAGAGAASLPSGLSRMRGAVFRQSMAETDPALQLELVGSVFTSGASTLSAYQGIHFITNSVSLAHTVDPAYAYFLGFSSDTNGAGELHQATVNINAAQILPGGA